MTGSPSRLVPGERRTFSLRVLFLLIADTDVDKKDRPSGAV